MKLSDLSDKQKLLMPEVARKAFGKAGRTWGESQEIAVAKNEKMLQGQLYALLYRRGHRPRIQRMDRKSNIAIGMPDIAFEIRGQSVHWEVKMPGKNPTPEQYKCHAELRADPNNAVVKIIRSYREGLDHLNEIGSIKVQTGPTKL